MLGGQLLLGSIMIVLTVIIHVSGLAVFIAYLGAWLGSVTARKKFAGLLMALSFTVLIVFFLHTVEIWSWALLYMWLGEFVDLERALYFSTVTFTTLGYGDITLGPDWQLLSGFEAANGIILVGVSTAFIFTVMRSLHAAVTESGSK